MRKPLSYVAIAILTLLATAASATPVGLQFAHEPYIGNGTEPQSIRIDVQTGLAIPELTIRLELRRYDANGALEAGDAPAARTETAENIRGGGEQLQIHLNIPATGFYRLSATATDADGKVRARAKTLLAALQPAQK